MEKLRRICNMCGAERRATEFVWEERHGEGEREYMSLSGCVRAIV